MSNNDEKTFIDEFLDRETASGLILITTAFLAIIMANSPLSYIYNLLIDIPVSVRIGALEIAKPLLLWVNDGLMAIFFLMVGLELKREVLEGELTDIKKVALPALGAIGGMAVPAAIYVFLNYDDPSALDGWAIPTATDIAFALGILALLGSRVPVTLKIFLTSLAIFDDIGAIVIIAFFYTSKISALALISAALCIAILFALNRLGITKVATYMFVGLVMWVSLLKSGVHATLAGVILAMFIPMRDPQDKRHSPLSNLEHELLFPVSFFILPIFAFCNAGVSFTGMSMQQIMHPIPLGIALGLFAGKQLGVFAFCWLGIKLRLAKLPDDISWTSLYGIAALCGIGFTMSLFIGSLAFEESGINRSIDERTGILIGSLASGLLGYLILRRSLRKQQ